MKIYRKPNNEEITCFVEERLGQVEKDGNRVATGAYSLVLDFATTISQHVDSDGYGVDLEHPEGITAQLLALPDLTAEEKQQNKMEHHDNHSVKRSALCGKTAAEDIEQEFPCDLREGHVGDHLFIDHKGRVISEWENV